MCVIFGLPFPWHDPVAQELHRLLYLLFPTAQQASLIAGKAGIDMGLIWQQEAAVFLWKDILDAAATGAMTRQPVEVANKHLSEQHPNKQFFIDLLEDHSITFSSDRSSSGADAFLGAGDTVSEPEAQRNSSTSNSRIVRYGQASRFVATQPASSPIKPTSGQSFARLIRWKIIGALFQ